MQPNAGRIAVALLAGVLLSGCVSTPLVFVDNDVLLTLAENDQIEVGGQRMTLSQTLRRLRSHPVPTDTMIKIRRAPNTSDATMSRVLRALQQAGYGRIVFVGERHIEVETH